MVVLQILLSDGFGELFDEYLYLKGRGDGNFLEGSGAGWSLASPREFDVIDFDAWTLLGPFH